MTKIISNLDIEYMSEVRNANIQMFGIMKRIAQKDINDIQGLVLIKNELIRQKEYLKLLAKDGI